MNPLRMIRLDIAGLGIIFYSPESATHIREHEDYFHRCYNHGDAVLEHIKQGTIVGFCTGSPGTYFLRILTGYPAEDDLNASEFKIRLALHARGGTVAFRDLYDLLDWCADVPLTQTFRMEDGFYHVTLCTSVPNSGVIGDQQEIRVYFQKLAALPELRYAGVPILCE
jgi:hypothetical protein